MSTFVGYLMPKSSLKKFSGTTYPIAELDKRVYTFPDSINLKMNMEDIKRNKHVLPYTMSKEEYERSFERE